jgi:propanol-preferring alcohol dehydrogenase
MTTGNEESSIQLDGEGQGRTIPKECKAGVVVNEGPNFSVKIEMVPVPEPAANEVLIRLNVTGICFSDLHFMAGDLDLPAMSEFGVRSPGHEGAGVVVKVGSDVKNWKVGERAGLKPVWNTCGDCRLCWTGKEAHCPHSIHTGIMRAGSYQVRLTNRLQNILIFHYPFELYG